MKDKLQTIIALFVVIGMVLSGMAYFATAEDLRQVAMRLDQKIINDKLFYLRQQLGQLEDMNLGKPLHRWSKDHRNRHRWIKEQIRIIEEERKLRR